MERLYTGYIYRPRKSKSVTMALLCGWDRELIKHYQSNVNNGQVLAL